jgi:hypothetical protein
MRHPSNSRISPAKGLIVLAFFAGLALVLGMAVRPWFVEHQAKAEPLAEPVPVSANALEAPNPAEPVLLAEAAGPGASAQAEHPVPAAAQLTQRVNNIEISASNFRLEAAQLLVDVCFEMPDTSDWTVWSAALDGDKGAGVLSASIPIEVRDLPVEGKQRVIRFDQMGGSVTTWEPAADSQKGLRCDTLYFDVQSDQEAAGVTLTIDAIAAYPREGEVCEAAYLEKVQKALDTRYTGIVVQCKIGDGTAGLVIASKPDTLSDTDAEALLYSNDLFLDVHGIRGPWVFTSTLK